MGAKEVAAGAALRRGPTPIPVKDRLLSRVVVTPLGCWVWQGYKLRGYGQINTPDGTRLTHMVSFELFRGPIPNGMELDHLCHNPDMCVGGFECPHRACVNPHHLDPVPTLVNAKRRLKSTCKWNHPYTDESTYFDPQGYRKCRICRAIRKETNSGA